MRASPPMHRGGADDDGLGADRSIAIAWKEHIVDQLRPPMFSPPAPEISEFLELA